MSNKTKNQYRPTIKHILIKFAPDKETKNFIRKLSKVKTKEDYNNMRNNETYKDIFNKYPEFTQNWQIKKDDLNEQFKDENGKEFTKNKNNNYEFYYFLNKKISQINPGKNPGKLYTILKRFTGDDNFDISQINQEIKRYQEVKEQAAAEAREEEAKQQAAAEAREEAEKAAEEATRNIKAEANKDKEEKVAQTKHKTEERTKKDYEEQLKEKDERIKQLEEAKNNNNNINTRLKGYVRDNYIIDSPQTREELIKKVSTDPNLNAKTEEVINKYVDYILGQQLHRIIKSKNKIIKTAKLFGNDADYLSKLDPMVREAVLKYQTDLINKTIIDKNNKYLLPKKYIKFEKAINSYKVNPLVLRGLYVK